MPHQCIHCSRIYDDGASEVLDGCSNCSSRFFFYLSSEKLTKLREAHGEQGIEFTGTDKKQIERDVREIAGIREEDAPVVLDFESVKILSPGKYVLDVVKLFSKKEPLVYKLEDGKYIIDFALINEKKD